MNFTKMHGIGNDYVYIDCFTENVDHPETLSPILSDRHKGIGGDGIILIKPSSRADCEMDIYNADGSRAKMCGNGIRCVAKYAYDHGIAHKKTMTIDTQSGIKTVTVTTGEDDSVQTVTVDMGEPILNPRDIPASFDEEQVIHKPISVGGALTRVTCVSMGNPHCVCFVPDLDGLNLSDIGPSFENHDCFPEGVNTEWIHVVDDGQINMRVWERGSGETKACGTGACASVVACVLNGLTARNVTVHLLGGDLAIEWRESDNHVYMTGPAEEVFTGTIAIGRFSAQPV